MSSPTTDAVAPAHVPAELIHDVDIVNDAEVLADPYLAFDRLREKGNILWSPKLGGHWIILGSNEVREAFQTPDAFVTYPTGIPPLNGFWPRKLIPQELDGDEHTRYRRLLTPLFSPNAIRPLAESIRKRTTRLIEAFRDSDEVEFIEELARPLPSEVFMDLFGLPLDQQELVTGWTRQLLHSGSAEKSAEAGQLVVGYLVELIERRSKEPTDDMLGALVTAEIDGEPLTAEELLDTSFLLFIAGLDTVTSQLGVVFRHLALHPELQREIREDPDLIPSAIEELLRVFPIVPPARTVTRTYELGGVTLEAGDTCLLAASAAARDPEVYDDPTTVEINRGGNWITAFGMGPHRCLGSHLARQELAIVLELMHELLPEFELAPDHHSAWHTAGNVWGLDKLQLRFKR